MSTSTQPGAPPNHGQQRVRSRVPLIAFFGVLATLAVLTILALVLVLGELTSERGGTTRQATVAARSSGDPALRSIVPATPWLKPPANARLKRIGVGSCLDQSKPQPIWQAIRAANPDLFLMIGDNIYAKDVKSTDARELIEAYAVQARHPELAEARAAFPFLAIWDDHDYGLNDAGSEFSQKSRSAEAFRAFWQQPEASPDGGGVYYSRTFGEPGSRVQVIMLDTRWFRSPLKLRDSTFPHWGKYQPDATPDKTMLGARQWAWLAGELRKPAEIRLLISSVQVLAEGHGFERWGNLPAERKRLIDTIRESGAGGVVLLSGDRHAGARYEETFPRAAGGRQLLVELTTSSLNRPYGPSKDARMPPLASDIFHPENFGIVDIDWQARRLSVTLNGRDGRAVLARMIAFDDLAVKN
ncbi:MAG: alkaline phosphatase D family protein [Hyphomicrobiaceae bacterium]